MLRNRTCVETRLVYSLAAHHGLGLLGDDVKPPAVAVIIHCAKAVIRTDLAAVRGRALRARNLLTAREAFTIVNVFFDYLCVLLPWNCSVLLNLLCGLVLVGRLCAVCVMQQVNRLENLSTVR